MTVHKEASLVDLSPEELKECLGATYHRIKNLEEDRKTDPDAQQMRDQLTAYLNDNYDEALKDLKKQMKAARALAKARGITWNMPTDADYHERKMREAIEGIRDPDGKGQTKVFFSSNGGPMMQIGGPK